MLLKMCKISKFNLKMDIEIIKAKRMNSNQLVSPEIIPGALICVAVAFLQKNEDAHVFHLCVCHPFLFTLPLTALSG